MNCFFSWYCSPDDFEIDHEEVVEPEEDVEPVDEEWKEGRRIINVGFLAQGNLFSHSRC